MRYCMYNTTVTIIVFFLRLFLLSGSAAISGTVVFTYFGATALSTIHYIPRILHFKLMYIIFDEKISKVLYVSKCRAPVAF